MNLSRSEAGFISHLKMISLSDQENRLAIGTERRLATHPRSFASKYAATNSDLGIVNGLTGSTLDLAVTRDMVVDPSPCTSL